MFSSLKLSNCWLPALGKCAFSVFGNHENALFYPLTTDTLEHFTSFPASNLEKVWNNDNCWLPVLRKVHFRYLETTKMYFSLLWLLTLCSISLFSRIKFWEGLEQFKIIYWCLESTKMYFSFGIFLLTTNTLQHK